MSRSRKHTPVFPFCVCRYGVSWYKKTVWHSERSKLRQALSHGEYEKAETRLSPFSEWASPTDGKHWENNFYPSWGFGVHNRYSDKEGCDIGFVRAMRK